MGLRGDQGLNISGGPEGRGRYRLERRVATGGMAEVFLATQVGAEGFERSVAIKRILPHLCEDEETVTMFRDEALLVANLSHPNIVQVYDLSEDDDGALLIAMEWIAGKDLRRITRRANARGPTLSPIRALVIAREVARALAHAHAARGRDGEALGLVHRDVTPHNVMLTYEGEVKLTDFGIAKASRRSVNTATGMIKGKVAYMSPEQARGEPVDGRTDIFALGIVLWELLTGRRLFAGDSDLAILRAVQTQAIPPPGSICADIPEALDALVAAALTRDLDARLPGAERFAKEAEAILMAQARRPEALALGPFMHALYPAEARGQRAGTARHPAACAGPTSLPDPSAPGLTPGPGPTTRPDRPGTSLIAPDPQAPEGTAPGLAATAALDAAALAETAPARARVLGGMIPRVGGLLVLLTLIGSVFAWMHQGEDLLAPPGAAATDPKNGALSTPGSTPVDSSPAPVPDPGAGPEHDSGHAPEGENTTPEETPGASAPTGSVPARKHRRRASALNPRKRPRSRSKPPAPPPPAPPETAMGAQVSHPRGGTRMLARQGSSRAGRAAPTRSLASGTRLQARLLDSARAGAQVQLELTRSVTLGEHVVLPRGTHLRAQVYEAGARLLLKIVEVRVRGQAKHALVARALDLAGHPGLVAADPSSPEAPLLLAPNTRLQIELLAPLAL